MENNFQICQNCVMDASDKTLSFDENGVCPRCNEYKQRIVKEWNHGRGHEDELNKMISEIKKSGQGKKYDCILGLSGGLDSSYLLHLAVSEWGLRPFVFHVDAGWNLPVAEMNIKRIPASWNEGAGPTADKTYIKDVMKKHGGFKTKEYVYTTGFRHKFWLPYVKGVKTVHLLNYVPFTKKEMIDTLAAEYGYEAYKQKHFEDLLTKFIEGWWLPTRFGYDIRKAQLSSLVVTGQMTRDEALEILKTPPLTEEEARELFVQVAEKLKISEEELMSYHKLPKTYIKYRNNNWAFTLGIKLYTILGWLNESVNNCALHTVDAI